MTHPGLSGTTAIRTVAGRRFGSALAEALVEAGAYIVGVARDRIGAPEVELLRRPGSDG